MYISSDALNKIFDKYWADIIKKVEYDFFSGKISFLVTDPDNHKEIKIIFIGVSSFLWIRNYPEIEKDFEVADYYEITSISCSNVKSDFHYAKWLDGYSTNFNISLEIWNSAMVMEAQKVKIDDEEYDIPKFTDESGDNNPNSNVFFSSITKKIFK